jgi:hypothetical protein
MARPKHTNIEIRGVLYPDIATAARKLGVSRNTVDGAIRRNALDTVGLGRGSGRQRMAVMIEGNLFANADAAARHYGVSAKAVFNAVNEGDPDRIARKRKGRPVTNAKPITIGPLVFASYRDASRTLGFSDSFISHAVARGTVSTWQRIIAAAMRHARELERTAA